MTEAVGLGDGEAELRVVGRAVVTLDGEIQAGRINAAQATTVTNPKVELEFELTSRDPIFN